MNIAKQQECRICKGELEDVLDLGIIYRSSFVKDGEDFEDQKAPLVLSKCTVCGLVQLKDTIDLDVMYKEQYWYSSSLNKSMISSLKDVVNDAESKINLNDGDVVLDIGANDGTLLNLYSKNVRKIGFDPAPNLDKHASIELINDYFSFYEYCQIDKIEQARVVTAIAMFYDLPDPNKFVEDVHKVLASDGIFVIQFTDLLSMFKACAFDNICHEHLEYYRLRDVVNLLRKHGMDAIDVSYNDVNGGSLRVTACHEGAYLPKPSLVSALTAEKEYFASHSFKDFRMCITNTILETRNFLNECKDFGKSVFLFGASTKGNTLLPVLGISDKQIPYAAEVNKEKFGLKTLGSNIKIISEDEAFAMEPDFFFVAIWHFKKNILANQKVKNYMERGGKLVFPLPYFHIVGKENNND